MRVKVDILGMFGKVYGTSERRYNTRITIKEKLDVANKVCAKAKRYAPVSEKDVSFEGVKYPPGYLREHIKVIRYGKTGVAVKSFAPYSIYVHEVLSNRHKSPTKAKFLEDGAIEVYNETDAFAGISIDYGSDGTVTVYIDDLESGNQIANRDIKSSYREDALRIRDDIFIDGSSQELMHTLYF